MFHSFFSIRMTQATRHEALSRGILIICILTLSGFIDGIKLVKKQLEEGITLSVPMDFSNMPDDVYQRKFGGYRKPIAMFVSPDGLATFGVNTVVNRSMLAVAQSNWNEKDLEMLKGMYKGSISAMHDEVQFLQDNIITIQKRKFIVFEFVGEVKDKDREGKAKEPVGVKQYSYILYTVEKNKILVFNFNCPAKHKQRWQPVAKAIAETIRIK